MRTTLARIGQATLLRGFVLVLLLRGVIALAFGIAVFTWPGLTLETLALLFATLVFIDGLLAVLLAGADLGQRIHWWWHLGEGVLGVVIGLITFFRSSITSPGLLYLIVIWALILGIFEIAQAFWTRMQQREAGLTFINGLLALLFGLILLIRPTTGALAALSLIVFYALVLGLMQATRAIRVYSDRQRAVPSISA
jgi:uncharacterized membrane protein HdeD (DUF308 family)